MQTTMVTFDNHTHVEQQFPIILQEGTVVATLGYSLWTTDVQVNSVARVFNILTCFQQCVSIVCTELDKQ